MVVVVTVPRAEGGGAVDARLLFFCGRIAEPEAAKLREEAIPTLLLLVLECRGPSGGRDDRDEAAAAVVVGVAAAVRTTAEALRVGASLDDCCLATSAEWTVAVVARGFVSASGRASFSAGPTPPAFFAAAAVAELEAVVVGAAIFFVTTGASAVDFFVLEFAEERDGGTGPPFLEDAPTTMVYEGLCFFSST